MRNASSLTAIGVALALILPTPAASASTAGQLDITFANHGSRQIAFRKASVALDGTRYGNGKTVVTGYQGGSLREFALARLLSDGSLDRSFGLDGRVTTAFGEKAIAEHVVRYGTAKVLAGGSSDDRLALAMYRADGMLDRSFSSDGRVILNITAGDDAVEDLVVQEDGRILVLTSRAILRLNLDGTMDDSFHNDGIEHLEPPTCCDYGSGIEWMIGRLVPDGKVILAGRPPAGKGLMVARLNADGSPDETFHDDGLAEIDSRVAWSVVPTDIILEPDGSLFVGSRTVWRSALLRFTAGGSLDDSFGNEGLVELPRGFKLNSLRQQSDERLLLIGTGRQGCKVMMQILRFHPNGTFDDSFHHDGRVYLRVTEGASLARVGILLPRDRLLLAGYAVARDPESEDDCDLVEGSRFLVARIHL